MRSLEEISADIASVGREAEGLQGGLVVPRMALLPQKLRVYADATVISGCEDDEFREASRRLIERCKRGEVTLVVSDVTRDEIARAPQAAGDVLASIEVERQERIQTSDEIESLAERYLADGLFTAKSRSDAMHIATATVAVVDVLVSWNFRRIVNLRRIRAFNGVNRAMGHPPLEIRTPWALDNDECASDGKPKRFDCVKFTREVRDRISAEIKDMNHEELQAYLDAGPRKHPLWTGIQAEH